MIVNTKVFNYKFTIGTLVVAIIVLATYGFSKYSDVKSNKDYLTHEKKLLQKELNDFIDRYDDLDSKFITLESKFENTIRRAQLAYDSLSVLKADVAVLSRYRAELMFLKKQTKSLQPDSLNLVIGNLVEEKEEISMALEKERDVVNALEKVNRKLEDALEKGSMIYANSFDAKVYRQKGFGNKAETKKAGNADNVEVCFVIAENPIAAKGNKNLYIQILGPDNNVVNDKGVVNFGESSLIYSAKLNIEYDNKSEEICAIIQNNETFKKGVYYVSIFENERKLGNTQIELF